MERLCKPDYRKKAFKKNEATRKLNLVFVSSQAHKKGILKITSIKFTKSIFNDENAQYYLIPNGFIHQRIYEVLL